MNMLIIGRMRKTIVGKNIDKEIYVKNGRNITS